MRRLFFIAVYFVSFTAYADSVVLPMRDRSVLIDEILTDRVENLLPQLMRREKIDMWILISREYNEDPVLKTFLPSTWLSARRRTILVIFDSGEGKPLERLAVARYQVGELFKKAWDKETQGEQWQRLAEIIKQRNPRRIAINKSTHFALADGLTATEHEEFFGVLDAEMKNRIISAEPLALAWLETRTSKEMQVYPGLVGLGHKMISEAFSNKVIVPGKSTTDDVVWWLREQTRTLKLRNWFHPSVSLQRATPEQFDHEKAFSAKSDETIIQPGDLLHVDFGLTYLRLNTDQQQHAYVLKPNETDAPEYLKVALARGNQLQDIFTANFKAGRTGNEVLSLSRKQAIARGIKPSIYTHPIGYHGHAAGTTLGMWDSQDGVPVQGDYPLHLNTAYSIELNAASYLPQWNKEIRIMLEEEAHFSARGVKYMDGRQTSFLLIESD
ncbi:MAG: M24 family metallopeptidase [Gammaproteobacteria bacterium]|nr:M24 family metallopeptidase [Gammaproteobacteria bacterium]